jgi:hypothetical protein
MTTGKRTSITVTCPKCGNTAIVELSVAENAWFPKEAPFRFNMKGRPLSPDFYCMNDDTKAIERTE